MLKIIQNFKGQAPATDPSLLPDNYAQTAENCDLRTGKLRPLKDLDTEKTWAAVSVGALRSLYKEESVDKWLYWLENDINIIKGQVADGNNRLFYSGDDYPKQTDDTLFPSTGRPDSTSDYRRLGVTPPATKLVVTKYGTPSGDVKYSTAYYYTYVCKWADGTEEESAPVETSDSVDVEGGEYTSVATFVKPNLVTSGNDVTHFRVYRLIVGSTSATFNLVKMRPGSSGATAVYDLPSTTTTAYDCNSVPDDLNTTTGEACTTEDWAPPPDDLAQLGQYQNGILAGFSGKKFCVSEAFVPYAWPENSQITLNYTPVAWGSYKGMAIIATTAFPDIVIGASADSLMRETLPYNQKCLSARGFVITNIGALYPSPDGLVLVNESGVQNLTKNVLTKQQWTELPPYGADYADMMAFYYDSIYIGFWGASKYGFIFNFRKDPYITIFEIPNICYHGCIDPTDDTLYLLTYISSPEYYYAEAWDLAATNLELTFKSKKFIVPNISFTCARIIGTQSPSVPIELYIYGDGTQIKKGVATWYKTVQDTDIFSLPRHTENEYYEIQITTKAEVDKIMIATSPEEIIEGMSL